MSPARLAPPRPPPQTTATSVTAHKPTAPPPRYRSPKSSRQLAQTASKNAVDPALYDWISNKIQESAEKGWYGTLLRWDVVCRIAKQTDRSDVLDCLRSKFDYNFETAGEKKEKLKTTWRPPAVSNPIADAIEGLDADIGRLEPGLDSIFDAVDSVKDSIAQGNDRLVGAIDRLNGTLGEISRCVVQTASVPPQLPPPPPVPAAAAPGAADHRVYVVVRWLAGIRTYCVPEAKFSDLFNRSKENPELERQRLIAMMHQFDDYACNTAGSFMVSGPFSSVYHFDFTARHPPASR
jgi:hypothetical protein